MTKKTWTATLIVLAFALTGAAYWNFLSIKKSEKVVELFRDLDQLNILMDEKTEEIEFAKMQIDSLQKTLAEYEPLKLKYDSLMIEFDKLKARLTQTRKEMGEKDDSELAAEYEKYKNLADRYKTELDALKRQLWDTQSQSQYMLQARIEAYKVQVDSLFDVVSELTYIIQVKDERINELLGLLKEKNAQIMALNNENDFFRGKLDSLLVEQNIAFDSIASLNKSNKARIDSLKGELNQSQQEKLNLDRQLGSVTKKLFRCTYVFKPDNEKKIKRQILDMSYSHKSKQVSEIEVEFSVTQKTFTKCKSDRLFVELIQYKNDQEIILESNESVPTGEFETVKISNLKLDKGTYFMRITCDGVPIFDKRYEFRIS